MPWRTLTGWHWIDFRSSETIRRFPRGECSAGIGTSSGEPLPTGLQQHVTDAL